ncbi:uncharacterized protein LOC121182597 [Toxotes jaculatrix]|uniref:uncharacterized protein LOC121182597 n=1 Tax=Toxotes jaculatrix TaxID=941984 RepID=UPI001B3B025A|nr:uncharacterized protein LOC121182597 [Toxotes jaculatrix]
MEEVDHLQTVTQQLCAVQPATPSASTASNPCSTPTSTLPQPVASTSTAPSSAPSSAPHTRREGAVTVPSTRRGSLTPNLDHLLDLFEATLLGPKASPKAPRNIKQRKAYVRKFLLYMSGRGTDINMTLLFLNDMVKLNGYLNQLSSTLKPTSQKHVLIDIETFLKFVRLANVPKVRMTIKTITYILDKLAAWKKGLGAQIVLQRLEYKRKKKAKLMASKDILPFTKLAENGLELAIRDLSTDPSNMRYLAQAVGLLVGVVAATTGHRKCVFLGMTTDDVSKAQAYKKSFAIRVADHKTVETFGPAMVTVTKAMMGHLTRSGKEMEKMGVFFTKAWKNFGLPGAPTLQDLRTAISTWVDSSLTSEETEKVNRSMCHDPKTAQVEGQEEAEEEEGGDPNPEDSPAESQEEEQQQQEDNFQQGDSEVEGQEEEGFQAEDTAEVTPGGGGGQPTDPGKETCHLTLSSGDEGNMDVAPGPLRKTETSASSETSEGEDTNSEASCSAVESWTDDGSFDYDKVPDSETEDSL